jgi:hypothetical protein
MTRLKRAGQAGALDVAASIAQFQEQIAALNDLMRQVAGNAAVAPGNILQADPLSAPFTLHVNPYTGNDRFVGGAYNTFEEGATDEEIIASKLKRIELQRLECGYTPYRPFKTINRAVIEAAIITSKNWYTYTDPRAHVDCVSIVLAPGVHILHNNPGSASTNLASWGTSKDPTIAELIAFNPASVGGVLLPRGCSLCGPDLRKTTIRPNWVPATSDENADYGNRRGMLKITGTGYFFGFTLMDKIGEGRSHHLLDTFHFASKVELDAFYAKTFSAVGGGADLASALTVSRPTEYEIVGPIDPIQGPTEAWDTTASASPYIFNCSIRSDYGLGGAWIDGSKVGGLKSMVCANFTGVSLQKDMTCWQRYVNGNWTTTNYAQYIAANPDDVRMNPARMSRHISAINDAFIQEVSVFAIGQGIHHFTDLGGEITVTNSNSSFGGCASLSKGYKAFAFPQDKSWTVSRIKVPLDIGQKTGNVRRIFLGAISSINSSRILLSDPLVASEEIANTPNLLARDGYSLKSNTFLWIENPLGDDWKATIPASAWSEGNPTRINIQGLDSGALETIIILDENNQEAVRQAAAGKRVYIRRVVDTRKPSERQISVLLENTTAARLPERNFVFQTDPDNQYVVSALPTTGENILVVSNAGAGLTAGSGVNLTAEITIRRAAPTRNYAQNTFYRKGTVVRYSNKLYVTGRDVLALTSIPDPNIWNETFVHMGSNYSPEDPINNEGLVLTVDTDTDTSPITTTCGINWNTAYTSLSEVRDQYRTSTDYLGAYAFLRALGFTDSATHAALIPRADSARLRDTNSSVDFPTPPSGGAATGRGYWGVEFRRPSVLRLYGHAWEWAGFLNYSKSIPAAQKTLGAQNKFTYYFTNQNGGRVVPQGSNEDGFNVTPRGLEDVETGTTLTVENLVGGSIDQRQQTSFQTIDVQNLTVNNLTLTGTLSGFDTGISDAKTDGAGLVKLAKANLLRAIPGSVDFKTVSGNNDTERNASIDQGADNGIVTIASLNYWRLSNNLISGSSGVVRVYVNPVGGSNASLSDLNVEPPTLPSRAVRTLARAVDWANASFGPSVTVEYRLGPGIYTETTNIIRFETIAIIRAWSYTNNTYLNTDRGGGAVPFNTTNFYNSSTQPIFLTRPTQVANSVTGNVITKSNPLTLRFKQAGTVIGVVWWGIMDTISREEVPDSFFPAGSSDTPANSSDPTNWRALARASTDNALNYYQREHVNKNPGKGLYGHRTEPFIKFEREGRIANVSLGAQSPADPFTPGDALERDPLIRTGAQLVTISGLRLVGNCNMSSAVNTGDFSGIRYRPGNYTTATYQHTGWGVSLFGYNPDLGDNIAIALGTEGPQDDWNTGNDTANYNQTWNNITLLNNSLQVASSTASAAGTGWKSIGPALDTLIGIINGTVSTLQRNWTQFRIAPGGSGGFVGKFGLYDTISATNQRTRGAREPRFFNEFGRDTRSTIIRVAGSGEIPTVSYSGLGPGEIGAYVNFDELNMRVRPYEQGVDVIEGRIHQRRFVL